MVPVKNRATLVLRTLKSIKNQTWRPLKVIVVDNGSSDGTPESVADWISANISEDFKAELLIEPASGAAIARNRGLEMVDSRFVMFFDSDDLMAPEHVESIMKRFYAADEPDLVFFRVRQHPIDGEDRVTKRPGKDRMITHICHSLMRTQGYACETALARRAGGWDEETRGWDDLEFGARVLMEARRRAYISDINVDVFAQVDSITGTEFSSRRGEWEKVLDKMESVFTKSHHKDKDKWIRALYYKRVILAAAYKREKNPEAAKNLFNEALSSPLLSPLQRLYLKASYFYASIGGRGSASLVNAIL